ncbi:uncharacterized protein LOC116301847 isoform X2 [Actinia tenebrosa]|uniref:Uncharacterized protein LOC116301847 isoform X2 n=1 Tax=Actinia tenebrosa TaxID=6105 RepID=A0A6P8IJ27_ACTTE|nr:uncharacterized protein LOC116301847 isoform X2 [Actinia tenebrosa]
MDVQRFFLLLFVFLLFFSCVEQKKKKTSSKRASKKKSSQHLKRVKIQNKLNQLCEMQKEANLPGTALELHAYFDLRPRRKPFACLKVTTCKGSPVCFVTTHPYLKNKSINDTTTWQELVSFIQRDRKIEPIYDSSMSGWNGDRYKALSQYVQNQPAIYRMCRQATVYRFVVNENVTNDNNDTSANSSSSTSTSNSSFKPSLPVNSNPAMTLCPLFKRQKGKSTRIKRVGRTKNQTSDNFFMCQGFNCPCVRICVGQGRNRKNFTECSTFRIICTFNCGSDTIEVPQVPIITKPTKRPTKRPKRSGHRRKKQGKKSRGRKKRNRNKKTPTPPNT